MSSELQQIASRANGAKSNGPITEEGKQASSQNRLDHGFNSRRIVLPGESQEEFDELLSSYLIEHQPETPTERTLIENMAIARWRQQRAWTLETAGLSNEIRRPRYHEGEDPDTQAFVAFRTLTDDTKTLDLLNRYEARFDRQFRAALTALLNLQARRAAAHGKEARAAEAAGKTAEPDSPPEGPKRVKLYWVDEEGNKTLAADSHPDPEPPADLPVPQEDDNLAPAAAVSGSFGNSAFPVELTASAPRPVDRPRGPRSEHRGQSPSRHVSRPAAQWIFCLRPGYNSHWPQGLPAAPQEKSARRL
jgi:hypothetical protein